MVELEVDRKRCGERLPEHESLSEKRQLSLLSTIAMLEERVESLESQLKDTTRKNPAEPSVAHVPPETAKELD